jgi:hypothetical protein
MTKWCVGLLLLVVSCGSVTARSTDGGSGTGGDSTGGSHGGGGASGAAGGVATDGAAGTDGGAARPLGSGCTDDSQCSSAICGKASTTDTSGTCCTGRPSACSSCVGGYIAPMQDGTSVGLCAMCEGGQVMNLSDGTPCGTAGPRSVRPPSCGPPDSPAPMSYPLKGYDYRCAAGACVMSANVDCSKITCPTTCPTNCPTNCSIASQGCFTYDDTGAEQPTAQCWCPVGCPSTNN